MPPKQYLLSLSGASTALRPDINMSQESGKFYKPEETIYYNDGREERLLEFIKAHPNFAEMRGNVDMILATIDEYGREKDFLMNVGSVKGEIVARQLIPELKPDLMVELGGYVGYSTLLFGNAVKQSGGKKFLSFEASPKFAAISRELVNLAGLDDTIEIHVGSCRESLRKLRQSYPTGVVDLFFIDHAKPEYLNDLKLCEELGLVGPNTTVVADDMNSSRVRDYQQYVRMPTDKKLGSFNYGLESSGQASEISRGDPHLVYETTVFERLDPTGRPDSLEVSRCVAGKCY
ncbi:unnamed protein product [Penicillium olsonii]|nr:unnamed protein product [Penicillium olsonii]